MDCGQIPEIIKLNVGGTRKFTTLRSTLTKEADSTLAQMFNGMKPVYKDQDGYYFLDGDGATFGAILDFLKYGAMPNFLNRSNNAFSAVSFGGLNYGRPAYTAADIPLIRHNAVKFGLWRLEKYLGQHSEAVLEQKLQEYRDSKLHYDECLANVLGAIPPEHVLMKKTICIRLSEENSMTDVKCCDHVCRQSVWTGFDGEQRFNEVDATVTVAIGVDSSLLAMLCYDLVALGYNIAAWGTSCCFSCDKVKHRSGFFVRDDTYCCRQSLYLLNFTLHTANRQYENVGLFGAPPVGKNLFGISAPAPYGGDSLFGNSQRQSCFGQSHKSNFGSGSQSQQQTGFSFGSSSQTPQPAFDFGSAPRPQQSSLGFGSASQQSTGAFGSAPQQAACGFGNVPQQAAFGGFGNAPQPPQQTNAFGAQTTPRKSSFDSGFGGMVTKSGLTFGVKSATPQQTTVFGSSIDGGGTFGKTASSGRLFGPSTTPDMNYKQEQTSSPAGFGVSKATTGPMFGGPPSFGGGFGASPETGQLSGPFGKLAVSDDEKKDDDSKNATSTLTKGTGGFNFGP